MDMDQMKFLEFDVLEGYVLYIPPYWWYSLQFPDANPLILTATYDSAMSVLANSWDLTKYFFQQHNIKEKVTRTFVAEPLPVPVAEEKVETVEKENENEKVSTDNIQNLRNNQHQQNQEQTFSINYPSGEPHTQTAAQLIDQIHMREPVNIREQNSQMFGHLMG
jgi:hypothetical protein